MITDSVSWFQLVNATTAKSITPSTNPNASDPPALAQDLLTQHDSKWLNNAFTKILCSVATQLHVYGAASDPSQLHGQTHPAPDKLFEAAIANAVQAVADDLCGTSTVLLISSADKGRLSAFAWT